MKASYKKPWIFLIDQDISKTDLRLNAEIGTVFLPNFDKNESSTSTDVSKKICTTFDCSIGIIMDFIKNEKNNPVSKSLDTKRPLGDDIFFTIELPIIKTIGTCRFCEEKYV